MWKLKGYTVDAFDQTQVVYNIWANTQNDLPSTMTDIGYGTALGFGSTAQTFDDSKEWRWNGTDWVEQTDGQQIEISADDIVYDNTSSGMTATNVQDALDELKDTDDTQDGALAELYGDNANQQLEIDYAINTGAKNLFPNTAISQTIGGVTFTVNDDGTVTVNGTKTNNDWFILSENNSFDANTYTLSDGLPNDTTDCQLIISTARSMSAAIMATAVNSRPQTKTFTTAQTGLYYAIRIASGKTVNNLTFKPMIRRAEITNNTYEPYAPTNRELYETKATIDEVFGTGTQITTNGTVNITQLGKFYCSNAATAATITGAPWSDAGFFGYTERSIVETDRYVQIAFRNDDSFRIAKRRYIGTWQPWSYIDTYDEGNLIPDNANLNDYTSGGKYYGGNSAGNSVSNLPVANSAFNFSLEVKNVSPVHTMQYLTILRTADDPYIYKRRYYGGSWGSWYRFTGETVVTSVQSVNSLSTLNLSRNDLNESLDTNFNLIDSIPEEEEGEQDV